jgi:hypothetical protein
MSRGAATLMVAGILPRRAPQHLSGLEQIFHEDNLVKTSAKKKRAELDQSRQQLK